MVISNKTINGYTIYNVLRKNLIIHNHDKYFICTRVYESSKVQNKFFICFRSLVYNILEIIKLN